jgi:5-(carboxyamino)imidazole ribonucleotide mutase
MGSKSDAAIVERAEKTLARLGIDFQTRVLSAHRTPDELRDFAFGAREAGFACVIAAAGKSAALPGAIAAHTTLPVIGLPVMGSALGGLDALLSIVQMPSGVPVAAVAIDGAENAAILAAQIIAVCDKETAVKLEQYKNELKENVLS